MARAGAAAPVGLAVVIAVAAASHGVLDAITGRGLGVGFCVSFDNPRDCFPRRLLEVSPLSAAECFDGVGVEILRREIAWAWVPLGRRRPARRTAHPHRPRRQSVTVAANPRPPSSSPVVC